MSPAGSPTTSASTSCACAWCSSLLVAASGAGFLAYAALWLFCPIEPRGVRREVPPASAARASRSPRSGVGLAFVLSALGGQLSGWVTIPLGVVLAGVALVWREADTGTGSPPPDRRARWLGGRLGLLRALAGALLVTAGIAAFLLGNIDLDQVQFGLLAALATLAGVVVLTVPWWLRLVRELGAERTERIRGQARADIAAHLHDSVLQTLALIQKQAGEDASGREVRRLARSQERELRAWLYGPPGGDTGHPAAATDATLAATLAAAAGEVEDDYGVRVAPVVVGDAPLDPDTAALVAAAREAMVNAAKHAGVDEIDVYAEVEPETVGDVRARPRLRVRPGRGARRPARPRRLGHATAWPATAARCSCAAHRARAPRWVSSCPVPGAGPRAPPPSARRRPDERARRRRRTPSAS